MSAFTNRIRNFISIFWYGVRLKSINIIMLTVNFAILIYSIYDIYQNPESLFGNDLLGLLIFLFLNIIWQVVSLVYDICSFLTTTGCSLSKPIKNPIDTNTQGSYSIENEYNLKEVLNTYSIPEHLSKDVPVIHNTSINYLLANKTQIALRYSEKHFQITREYIKLNKGCLSMFLIEKWGGLKTGTFHNETKLCQASEIKQDKKGYYITLGKGTYYDSFLTNDIYTLCLNHQNREMLPPMNYRNYGIRPFEQSIFGNHLGVSTIAITADDYALILRHNKNTAVSADKLAGSGSGSVDFADWKRKKDTDLREILTRAAIRELSEETGLKGFLKTKAKEKDIIKSEIIGMYRNLERGGKPDFCLVTYIDATTDEVSNAFKAEKKEVVDNFQFIELNQLENFLETNKEIVSVSLYMNFYYLKQYVQAQKQSET